MTPEMLVHDAIEQEKGRRALKYLRFKLKEIV